jgi:predicted RNA-binding protein YlxR (DUF448 family)
LAGRGAYLCADASCWDVALAKGAVARALAVSPGALREVLATGPDVTAKTNETTKTTMTTTGGDKRGEE